LFGNTSENIDLGIVPLKCNKSRTEVIRNENEDSRLVRDQTLSLRMGCEFPWALTPVVHTVGSELPVSFAAFQLIL
jgi:hypothetical protein